MLSLHTNASALSAQNSVGSTQNKLSTSMTRLSTGFRINSAMDDAAGLQIATRLKAQTSGMAMAMRNTQNSISMMQTAEGAFEEVTSILVRMKDLATQAADASSNADDKTAMQSEYDALGLELTNIMANTSFGGAALFKEGGGTLEAGPINFQIGASTAETMELDLSTAMGDLHTALGGTSALYDGTGTVAAGPGTELTAAGSANTIIDTISAAITEVGEVRSTLGATSNRLDHVYNNLSNISTNTKAATGRIMDVDYAAESSNMTTQQMLTQAGTAMLKQSNSMSGLVMSLLQ
ncbi:Lateral flagellin [Noviherbaspirillum cavernae]|uniref:Flagellin n=1 Tax=Noviherbaspirillum cavernae TaxID=2320862 RepID=A0A418WVK1_9BURK|nr:flagellin [Noviherbaspirillum cavernae]RJF96715.1 Lateral flagellin [Noviherbaspirillum cavernae]